MNTNEIVNEIVNSNLTREDLKMIYNTCRDYIKLLDDKEMLVKKSKMEVGMTGKLTNIRPARYNGTEVKIINIKKTRVLVQEVETHKSYTVPVSCIII